MEQKYYTVAQAAQLLETKGSVLRYWEEELNLSVHRNAQGHRCYTRYDIQMFQNIKELKRRGLKLQAIKDLLPKIVQKAPGSTESKIKLLPMEGMEEEQVVTAGEPVEEAESETSQDSRMLLFQEILQRLVQAGLQERAREELRYRTLDETIRKYQMARRETAAAEAAGNAGKRKRPR